MKKFVLLISIFIISFCMLSFTFGGESRNLETLYNLEILKGDGNTSNSEEIVSNIKAATIQLRLMNLESEAMSSKKDWVSSIIEFTNNHPELGWKKNFNPSSPISAKDFQNKLFLALEYNKENQPDIFPEISTKNLSMDNMSELILIALNSYISEKDITLSEYLVENGVINREKASEEKIVKKFNNNLATMAVAWKQTAAEYKALYHQAFNMARFEVEKALSSHTKNDKPLAIVTDVDDTILSPVNYWGYLIENDIDFFNDEIWDKWIPENKSIPTAGAIDFLKFCKENNVEIFYVTSRDQGENTYQYALDNLKSQNFPYADEAHLTVLRDTSNKEKVHNEIAKKYNIVVKLGDNLNDFNRSYYVTDVDERIEKMEATKDLYGSKYILFPNPTDGHWIKAIFGSSEPDSNNKNRELWEKAAMTNKWNRILNLTQ